MNRGTAFVAVQFVLFVAYYFNLSSLTFPVAVPLRWIGWGVTILGGLLVGLAVLQLNTNLSPFPQPKVNGQLVDTGLYAWVRHPIYTGLIVGTLAYGLTQGSGWKLLIAGLLTTLFYFKTRYEEALLRTRFDRYTAYMKRTGRFFPTYNKSFDP